MRLVLEGGTDKRRANLLTTDEMDIFLSDEIAEPGERDVVLAVRDQLVDPDVITNELGPANRNGLIRVQSTHAAYLPLHYVMLFVSGQTGWHPGMTLKGSRRQRKKNA